MPMGSELPRNVWATALASFFTDISSDMLINLLPLFLANVLGTPTTLIGLIEGVSETTSSLLKGVSGWLSDKLRARKNLAVAGYGISALAKPLLYFATAWTMVLFVRFSDRVGKGIRTAPRDALLADSIDERSRGLAFGLHRAGDTAGAVLGLVIALLVVLATQAQTLTLTRATFQTLVLISIVPGALGVLALAFGAREVPLKPKSDGVRLSFGALNPSFRFFLLAVAIFTLGNSSDGFIVLLAQERGLNVVGTLAMLISFNVVHALFSTFFGGLSDRFGRKRLMIGGWLLYGLLYLGFAASTTSWQVWALYILYGFYYAAVEGTAKALVADLIPSEQRGTAYGFYNATVGLMALPASVMAGFLWQTVGVSAAFLVGALLALAAVGLLTRLKQ